MSVLPSNRSSTARGAWRLAAAAAAVFAVAVLGSFGLLLAYFPQSAAVRVRWTVDTGADTRRDLEQRFHLNDGRLEEGTTWSYRLDDLSTSNIRSLVQHAAVDDTARVNRVRYRPELAQDPLRRSAIYATFTGLVAALAFLAVTARARRRAGRAPAPETDAGPAPPLRESRWWTAAALVAPLPLVIPLCLAMWKTPYPISETLGVLEDAETETTSVFDPTVRSWFRPLYHLTWRLLWHGPESAGTALPLFKLLGISAAAGLVMLFVWHLRPRTLMDAAAAAFGVAVLIGMPGYRDNLELPLLMSLVGMPLALGVWMLLERTPRAWHGVAIVALALIAIGFKEQGLVIVPIVVASWWAGAAGAGRRTTAVTVVLTLAYLAVRLGNRQAWDPFEQDVGIGFGTLPASEASKQFGSFPWMIYAYNAASTAANVLFSEPSAGQFRVVFNATHGQLEPWELNHVLSSTALTGLIAWWGIRTLKRDAGALSYESRVFIAMIVAVAASGALGFNYARDRLGGMAVVFYALAACFAVRDFAARAALARSHRRTAVAVALMLLAAAWQLRAVGTLEAVRIMSAKNQREWITDLNTRRVEAADRPAFLHIMEAMIPQGLDPGAARPTPYPEAFQRLIGTQ